MLVAKLTRVKNLHENFKHVKNPTSYHIITDENNWYLVVTDVSDKNVKNWNQMQNGADLGIF